MDNNGKYQRGNLEIDGFKTPFVVYSPLKELTDDKKLENKMLILKESLISKLIYNLDIE